MYAYISTLPSEAQATTEFISLLPQASCRTKHLDVRESLFATPSSFFYSLAAFIAYRTA